MKLFAAALAALSLGAAPASASEFPETLGPEIGTVAPHNLALSDETGNTRDLKDLAGENGLVLLFNRSMDWCGYCQRQVIEISGEAERFRSRGYELAALTYDPVDTLARFDDRRGIAFPLLSDPDSEAIDAFDLRNEAYAALPDKYGAPHPAIFVIDPTGTIQAKLYEEDYKVRPPVDVVLETIDGLEPAG